MSSSGTTLHSETFSIVAVGQFNPAIFQPSWLAKNNLIRDEEAESAKVRLISGEVAIVDGAWFSLQVTSERFALESLDPVQNLAARDLAVGVFKILEHTPLNAIGLNVSKHYQLESESTWHQFGDYFAPKELWNTTMKNAGMRRLEIVGNVVYEGDEEIPIRIVLEPSKRPKQFGVLITINHHYQKLQETSQTNAGDFIELVSKNYGQFLEHVDETIIKIFSMYTEAKKRTNGKNG